MLRLGLGATFYFPYRRLWMKFTPEGTAAAGVAPAGAEYADTLETFLHFEQFPRPRQFGARRLRPADARARRLSRNLEPLMLA